MIGIEDPAGGAVTSRPSSAARQRCRRDLIGTDQQLADPRTGRPPPARSHDGRAGWERAQVGDREQGPDPAWAEVWSKVLFLAGSGAIAGEARARGIAAWWIDASGGLAMTPAARSKTVWVDGEG